MRKATLKSYVKNNFENYLKTYKNSSKRMSWLLTKSENDERLAEVAQAYFLVYENYKNANKFSKYTKEEYSSLNKYKESNSKYVVLFKSMSEADDQEKEFLREDLLKLFKKNNVSLYKVSKTLNTSQSNVSRFFNKKENNTLSLERLENLLKVYKR